MKKKKRSPLSLLLLLLCLAVAAFSAWKLYGYYRGYHDGEKEYEELTQYVKENEDGAKKGKKDKCPITVDFDALRAINEDVVAWVYIEDTGINYPVVQGEDNEYYLHHTFERKENFSGAIFMDITCHPDFTSDNSILFGHNLKTGEMFGMLKRLYDTEYNEDADWKKHPVIWVVTPDAATGIPDLCREGDQRGAGYRCIYGRLCAAGGLSGMAWSAKSRFPL